MFASGDTLLRVLRNDHARAQRMTTGIATLLSLSTFALAPVAGGLMDRFGRKPFLVAGCVPWHRAGWLAGGG